MWSALEYACHVRDVLLVQRERLYLALVEDTPSVAPMYRDERATPRYNLQDPKTVAEQITVAANLAGQAFADLDEVQWLRRLIYNFPAPQERTVIWLAQHTPSTRNYTTSRTSRWSAPDASAIGSSRFDNAQKAAPENG